MAARKVPTKYTSGLGESTADRRRAEIRKRATGKKESFEPLPGDARAKTKPSKYTQRIKASGLRQVIKEDDTTFDDDWI